MLTVYILAFVKVLWLLGNFTQLLICHWYTVKITVHFSLKYNTGIFFIQKRKISEKKNKYENFILPQKRKQLKNDYGPIFNNLSSKFWKYSWLKYAALVGVSNLH